MFFSIELVNESFPWSHSYYCFVFKFDENWRISRSVSTCHGQHFWTGEIGDIGNQHLGSGREGNSAIQWRCSDASFIVSRRIASLRSPRGFSVRTLHISRPILPQFSNSWKAINLLNSQIRVLSSCMIIIYISFFIPWLDLRSCVCKFLSSATNSATNRVSFCLQFSIAASRLM